MKAENVMASVEWLANCMIFLRIPLNPPITINLQKFYDRIKLFENSTKSMMFIYYRISNNRAFTTIF